MRKSTTLPHRKRAKTARRNAKQKRKLQRRRLRASGGARKFAR